MAREYVTVPKEMYLWAIERAGYKVDEFLQTHPDVAMYVEGEKKPTIKQLEAFVATVHVPMAYLMLPSPPIEVSPIPMFRGKAGNGKFDLNVYQTVLDIQGRQEWLSDYLVENELDKCEFAGKYSIKTPIKDMTDNIRRHLDLEIDWMMSFSTPDKAINYLVEKMENVGICVFFNGIVGNNTHRTLDVEECRGFALVGDNDAPMIFVNNSDSKNAQMFTLAHEFTHVLVGVSAGYAGFEGEYHDLVETYCDKVAAEFLVPGALLIEHWTSIEDCAKVFNVSTLVIARRAHDEGIISDEEYRRFFLRYRANVQSKKKSSGGAFYKTATKRIGRLFAIHVYNAVRSKQLSYTEAYRLTGLYGKTFDKFMTTSI
jgi:Zn-dependent peptidase ImmA (M78 family)